MNGLSGRGTYIQGRTASAEEEHWTATAPAGEAAAALEAALANVRHADSLDACSLAIEGVTRVAAVDRRVRLSLLQDQVLPSCIGDMAAAIAASRCYVPPAPPRLPQMPRAPRRPAALDRAARSRAGASA